MELVVSQSHQVVETPQAMSRLRLNHLEYYRVSLLFWTSGSKCNADHGLKSKVEIRYQ